MDNADRVKSVKSKSIGELIHNSGDRIVRAEAIQGKAKVQFIKKESTHLLKLAWSLWWRIRVFGGIKKGKAGEWKT